MEIYFLDIFFEITEGAGDDDDDDDDPDWLFEIQEPDGKQVNTQVFCQAPQNNTYSICVT